MRIVSGSGWLSCCALAVVLAFSGCSASKDLEGPTGQLDIALVGQAASGTLYRLRTANIMVQGPSSTIFFNTEEEPNQTTMSRTVVTGAYSAFLQEGWSLEKVAADGTAVPVEATFLSANPQQFDVTTNARTVVTLRFHAGRDIVTMDQGSFDIVLGVEENPVQTGVICSTDAQCATGQTCCMAGFLGMCYALNPGQACPLPDLTVSIPRATSSLSMHYENFPASSCAIAEGCVNGSGDRRLLSFDTQTPNIGAADAILGDPSGQPGFEFSQCHNHYHFEGYAKYELLDANGMITATGHKQAFCLLDSQMVVPGSAPNGRYHCGFQGIQAGWSDVYPASLDCQWVDITTVPAGDYSLRITINPQHTIPESNYDNNTITLPVHIDEGVPPPPPPPPGDPLVPCAGAQAGQGRDCGWSVIPGFQGVACTPGTTINIGCNPTCGGAIAGSSCEGDTLLRVCSGGEACAFQNAIFSNDDSCGQGNFCSAGNFVCPASGVYTAMTASYNSAEASTCVPVATP